MDKNQPPNASFSIAPVVGGIETMFLFDASTSYDEEDDSTSLQVRWDWENDGNWDTNYSIEKLCEHQFSSPGKKNIILEVKDSAGLTDTTKKTLSLSIAPIAIFSVTPLLGDTTTIFEFDASNSLDNEEDLSSLQVRWDWEDDGEWDTEYSSNKIVIHKYIEIGIYAAKMQIKNNANLTDSALSGPIEVVSEVMRDIDGNIYRTVKIGDQLWTVENLKVTRYRNRDDIPLVEGYDEWVNINSGACCAYNNDMDNVALYGLLYNWYAVEDDRNVAPEGWHVPSEEEWKDLERYLGMEERTITKTFWRGTDQGTKLKEEGIEHWVSPNSGATNETGFSAFPGGARLYAAGTFHFIGEEGCWWSRTEYNKYAWSRRLGHDKLNIYRDYDYKQHGFSIRCVKSKY